MFHILSKLFGGNGASVDKSTTRPHNDGASDRGVSRLLEVERSRRWRAERALQERDRQFQAARQVQRRLWPRVAPALAGFEIVGASYPAAATSGDYFDYFPLADESLGLAIGDVSGHGLGSALLMVETRAYLHALAWTHHDVGQILTLANQVISADIAGDHFITLLLARLDCRARSLEYASAGHPSGYVLDRWGGVRMLLASTVPPLGLDWNGDCPTGPAVGLGPGDLILLVTDGLYEATSPADVQFGMTRAIEVVQAHRTRPAREIVKALYTAVRRHRGNLPLEDDATALIIKVTPAV